MIFFKQNITTEKRLSIAHGCVLEVQGIQRASVSSPQPEGLWQEEKRKEETFPFHPIVAFLLVFLPSDKTLQPNLPFFWNQVLNAAWEVSALQCSVCLVTF